MKTQIMLSGTDSKKLDPNIKVNSEIVKTIDMGSPYSEGDIYTVDWTLWKSLIHQNLVNDSCVVAADRDLNTVYTEGTDYEIDYKNGKIRTLKDSAIATGSIICVWYFYYTIYARGKDYDINYYTGEIKRTEDSNIVDGSTVYIEYEIVEHEYLFTCSCGKKYQIKEIQDENPN